MKWIPVYKVLPLLAFVLLTACSMDDEYSGENLIPIRDPLILNYTWQLYEDEACLKPLGPDGGLGEAGIEFTDSYIKLFFVCDSLFKMTLPKELADEVIDGFLYVTFPPTLIGYTEDLNVQINLLGLPSGEKEPKMEGRFLVDGVYHTFVIGYDVTSAYLIVDSYLNTCMVRMRIESAEVDGGEVPLNRDLRGCWLVVEGKRDSFRMKMNS